MERVEKAALRLIARAEQNSFALAQKLERRGFNGAEIKNLISSLIERDLLNDERYAELWLRSRLSQKKASSPLWLQISLEKRGIDRESARKALGKVLDKEAEYALLLRYLEKLDLIYHNNTTRLKSKLKSEGFSFELINGYFENMT